MQITISCVQPNCGDWVAVSFLRRWIIMRKQKQEFYWFGAFLIDCRKTKTEVITTAYWGLKVKWQTTKSAGKRGRPSHGWVSVGVWLVGSMVARIFKTNQRPIWSKIKGIPDYFRNSIEKCFVYEQIKIIQILVIQLYLRQYTEIESQLNINCIYFL